MSAVAVVGAGIVGLAVARALASRGEDVLVLEKEDRVAAHQTGHNSGVVHAGIYYPPGSLKATLCAQGRVALREYCRERGLPYRELGKLVVAADESELDALADLEDRARANGVPGLARLDGVGLRRVEPHVAGVAGLNGEAVAVLDLREIVGHHRIAAVWRVVGNHVDVLRSEPHGGRKRDLPPARRVLRLEVDAGQDRAVLVPESGLRDILGAEALVVAQRRHRAVLVRAESQSEFHRLGISSCLDDGAQVLGEDRRPVRARGGRGEQAEHAENCEHSDRHCNYCMSTPGGGPWWSRHVVTASASRAPRPPAAHRAGRAGTRAAGRSTRPYPRR